jgi:hypothetical protein
MAVSFFVMLVYGANKAQRFAGGTWAATFFEVLA